MILRVLRVEYRNYPMRGVYCNGDGGVGTHVDWHHPSECGWGNLPGPIDDSGILRRVREAEVCACATLDQFDKWWPAEVMRSLERAELFGDHEACVVVLEGEAIVGRYQAIINRGAARVVHRFTFKQFNGMSPDERATLLKGEEDAFEYEWKYCSRTGTAQAAGARGYASTPPGSA